MGEATRWFQLYWINDREVAASFVRRAEASGYGAIVVTLDTPTLAWRPRDLRQAYLPFIRGEGCAQFFTDPVFCAKLDKPPLEDMLTAAAMMLATFPNLGLTWDDLAWMREQTSLPLLVKGVLRGDDAELARERGVDGIIVSNHGGRQVDGAIAALDALVEIRETVGPEFPLLVDGGIRRGADVIKAMALGADAVLLGRLYAYGLAVGGAAGVEAVCRQLLAEVDLTLALCGGSSIRDLDFDAAHRVKLLLTSAGIRNPSIRAALDDLLAEAARGVRRAARPDRGLRAPACRPAARVELHRRPGAGVPMAELGWRSLGVLEVTALPSLGH